MRLALVFLVLLITACSTGSGSTTVSPTHDILNWLDRQPSFAPLVPVDGITEYQVTWSRSWQPRLHFRVRVDDNWRLDEPTATISYYIEQLNYDTDDWELRQGNMKVTYDEAQTLSSALEASGFWDLDTKCVERSYQERSIFYDDNGDCSEVTVLDGARISIAASQPTRAKGILSLCPELMTCQPYEELLDTLLRLAKIPRSEVEKTHR